MSCRICGCQTYIEILNKDSIAIWTGSSEVEVEFYPSNLKQCTQCGHVYEVLSLELEEKLTKIYSSTHAQVSTPPGDGNWGIERAGFFLKRIDYTKYDSAIEIGCADGYFLKFLEDYGYSKLIGIEPSLPENSSIGKIELISAFVNDKTQLESKVDLVFSSGVFEHIEDINGVLQFCKNHLNEDGELFFAVPNSERELEDGDPGLFLHEHVHYYTSDVIKYLLANNGFEIKTIIQECSAIYVSAKLNNSINISTCSPKLYTTYSQILDHKLSEFEKIMQPNRNIIIHGTNDKLNNILGWIKKKFKFTLVDNDEKKIDRYFFDQKVKNIHDLDLTKYDSVIIIPTCFYQEIEDEYTSLGFSGSFYKI